MKQFEIRWADMPAPVGRRPVLLLSRSAAYKYLTRIIVVEITTTIRGIPQEVALGIADGLPQACVANLDNTHVVRRDVVREKIAALLSARHREVKRALGYALGWEELKIL